MSDLLSPDKFDTPVSESVVAADWQKRGYSCAQFVDPPGQRWEDFVHSCNELVMVQEGLLEMEVSGEVLQMKPGDEVFIPKNAIHSVRNIHSGISKWLYGYD